MGLESRLVLLVAAGINIAVCYSSPGRWRESVS
jgi:hypothetical protein